MKREVITLLRTGPPHCKSRKGQTMTLDEKMALGLEVWFIRETLNSTGTSEEDGIL